MTENERADLVFRTRLKILAYDPTKIARIFRIQALLETKSLEWLEKNRKNIEDELESENMEEDADV